MSDLLNRRKFLMLSSAAAGSVLLKSCATRFEDGSSDNAASNGGEVIKVGILHSLTGSMAISETAVVDAEEMAIREINASGGVLGKQILAVKEDGASDWPTFKDKAVKLIDQDKVSTVFGCWTSASRKAVKDTFETKNHLLWYPVQYEGQECSKNIFYTGATPNQQIEPAVDWLLKNKGNKFFLVGSDYVFPRTANDIIKAQLKANDASSVGEAYIPLGSSEVSQIIQSIKKSLPKGGVIFNTLNGNSNVAFFKELKAAGLNADKYPVMSVSLAEEEVQKIGPEFLAGHFAAWNYFQAVVSPDNREWVVKFKDEYGTDRVTNDPMEAAYVMVYLWKMAVEKAGTTDIDAVREAAYGLTFDAPNGLYTMNENHHLSKTVRIGRVQENGLFNIVYSSDMPIQPQPWNQYLLETKGKACDWSDPEKGELYSL